MAVRGLCDKAMIVTHIVLSDDEFGRAGKMFGSKY